MKTLLVIGWIVFVIFVITFNFGARDDDNDEDNNDNVRQLFPDDDDDEQLIF